LRFAQDIFTDIGSNRNTLQFTIDIFNFGNLINNSWGIYQSVNAPAILVPTNQNAISPTGDVRPTFRLQTDRECRQPLPSEITTHSPLYGICNLVCVTRLIKILIQAKQKEARSGLFLFDYLSLFYLQIEI
jgi:hypothetical protein